MSALAIIAAFLISPAQGAPIDVSKNHWAFPEVDRLFKEGLLKGYPSGESSSVKLDKTVTLNEKQTFALLKHWKEIGLQTRDTASRSEIGVVLYIVWYNLRARYDRCETEKQRQAVRKEIPDLARAISAYNEALTQRGNDPQEMINSLNDILDRANRPFKA